MAAGCGFSNGFDSGFCLPVAGGGGGSRRVPLTIAPAPDLTLVKLDIPLPLELVALFSFTVSSASAAMQWRVSHLTRACVGVSDSQTAGYWRAVLSAIASCSTVGVTGEMSMMWNEDEELMAAWW